MSSKKVSTRVDPDVLEAVERVAEVERRPISSVVRNVLSDWAKARENQTSNEAAA